MAKFLRAWEEAYYLTKNTQKMQFFSKTYCFFFVRPKSVIGGGGAKGKINQDNVKLCQACLLFDLV
jgi:hypothetical protein